jgi:hypothetical protein
MLTGRCAVLLLVLTALAGCASGVTVPDQHRDTKPEVRALRDYTVELSPHVKEQLPDNIKFDVAALTRAIDRSFAAHNLVATDGEFRLKIVVTDIRVRSTFSAMMWGFMAGDDHVNGDGFVSRVDGDSSMHEFKIKTSYALGGLAGGQDSTRMDWIYEEFAKKLAEYLVQKRDAKKPA